MSNLPFESVTLTFKNESFEVEPERVWGLIKTITGHIGITKLSYKLINQDTDDALFCEAFAAALRYAGRKNTTDIDVFMSCTGIDYFVDIGVQLYNVLKLAMPKNEEAAEIPEDEKKS